MAENTTSHSGSHIFLTVGIVVSILLSGVTLLALAGAVPFANVGNSVKTAILENEYAKVGGKEGYDLIQQAQELDRKDPNGQFAQQMKSMKEYIATKGGKPTGTGTTTPTPAVPAAVAPTPTGTFSVADIPALRTGQIVDGTDTADILLIEYSDFGCHFCKKFHSEGTINKLSEKYGAKFSHILKPVVSVSPTPQGVLGAICVGKLFGKEKYDLFTDKMLGGSAYTDAVALLALDTKKLDTCIADAGTLAAKTANENEQQKLTNARGTPGFFIVNTKTGKSAIVSGAYPVDEFISKIDALLK